MNRRDSFIIPKWSTGPVPWTKLLLTCATVAFVGWIIFYRTSNMKEWPTIPGWDDLIYCSYMQSLDGTKQLSLSNNHFVRLYDKGPSKDRNESQKDTSIDGTWSFDETSKLYAVTLNGATTVYSVAHPENSYTCLLIKGELESANLRESWFSLSVEDIEDERENEHDSP